MRRLPKSAWLLAALSGGLQVLIFPSPSLHFLAWIALAPLIYALLRPFAARPLPQGVGAAKPAAAMSVARGFLLGWLAWIVWSFGSCYWIASTMTHYGGLGLPAALGVLVLFTLALASCSGLFALLLVRIAQRLGVRWALVAAPFLWVAVELFHNRVIGFPWDLLGYSQVDNIPLARIATFSGVYGVSFAIALVNAAFAAAFLAPREGQRTMLAAALAAAVILQLGVFIQPPPVPATRSMLLVQQDIPILDGAWDSEFYARTLQDLVRVSAEHGSAPPGSPGLIVWPESPAPFFTGDPLFRSQLALLAQRTNSYIIAGSITQEGPRYYNSALLIGPDGLLMGRYDKMHLVPFGEYVPFKSLLFFAGKLTKEVGDFTPGTERTVFRLPGGAVGAFICYESIFPDEIRRFAADGAQVFVNISNDEWFGRSGAPFQHLNMARMRAIENHRWLLRDTNNGITVSIDPYGRVVAGLPRDQRAVLAAPYGLETRTTFYTRHGDWFAWLCVIISLAALLVRLRVRPGISRM